MLFVFGSLLEYAFVNVLARKQDRPEGEAKVEDVNGEEDRVSLLYLPLCVELIVFHHRN